MTTVNMSLDEIIRKSKVNRSGGGGGSGKKKSFGQNNRERGGRSFPTAASRGSGIEGKWKHDLFHEMQTIERVERKARAPKVFNKVAAVGKDARISITNLPQDISDLDLEEMFQPFNFNKVQVNYNAEGLSLGTADVFFDRASDANRAMKEFSGASIDGVPLKMAILSEGVVGGTSISERLSLPKTTQRVSGGFRAAKSLRSPMNGRINKKSKRTSGSSGGNKAGRFLDRLADDHDFQREERGAKKLADLDRELDEYMSHNKKGSTKMEE